MQHYDPKKTQQKLTTHLRWLLTRVLVSGFAILALASCVSWPGQKQACAPTVCPIPPTTVVTSNPRSLETSSTSASASILVSNSNSNSSSNSNSASNSTALAQPKVELELETKPKPAGTLEPSAASTEKRYTEEEVEICAKLLYGEARGCSTEEQALVIWCICNRVDSTRSDFIRFTTIKQAALAPYQFHGYSATNPVLPELTQLVRSVLDAWSLNEPAATYAPYATTSEYLYFFGDGSHNWYREEY